MPQTRVARPFGDTIVARARHVRRDSAATQRGTLAHSCRAHAGTRQRQGRSRGADYKRCNTMAGPPRDMFFLVHLHACRMDKREFEIIADALRRRTDRRDIIDEWAGGGLSGGWRHLIYRP